MPEIEAIKVLKFFYKNKFKTKYLILKTQKFISIFLLVQDVNKFQNHLNVEAFRIIKI